MTTTDDQDEGGAGIERYVLTDGDGEAIPGEEYENDEHALDARARLMAEHPDGESVTVEVLN